MRMMTMEEMLRVFHLREHGHSKKTRKKNHHRMIKYMNRFGLVPSDYEKYK